MSTVLVTGAAGFIAYKVCEQLLQTGHRALGIDNMNDAYDIRLKKWHLAQLLPYKNFSFSRLDIRNRKALEESFTAENKIDAVINLAARAGVRYSVDNPWEFMETNLTGTLNLLEMCRKLEIPKFVLASSSSIYGSDPQLPTSEEADSSRPLQPYAASKKAAEVLCYSYHHLFQLDVTVFRYFTVYGPAGRPDLAMFRFTQRIREGLPVRINGDGKQSRGFTYIDDIARGTLLGLQPLGFEIINLGGHEQITINNLIKLFEKIIGKKAKLEHLPAHPADMHANWADVSKAKRILGWQPQVTLQEGLEQLVKWYDRERRWASQIDTE